MNQLSASPPIRVHPDDHVLLARHNNYVLALERLSDARLDLINALLARGIPGRLRAEQKVRQFEVELEQARTARADEESKRALRLGASQDSRDDGVPPSSNIGPWTVESWITCSDGSICGDAMAPRGWYCQRAAGHEGPCANVAKRRCGVIFEFAGGRHFCNKPDLHSGEHGYVAGDSVADELAG